MKFMRNSRIFFQHPAIFCFFPKGFKEFSEFSKHFSHVNKLFQKICKNIAFPQQKCVSEKVGPTAIKYIFLRNPQHLTATTGGGSPDPQHLTATTGGGYPDPQHFTATTGGGSPDPQRQTGSRISMKFMRNSRIFFSAS